MKRHKKQTSPEAKQPALPAVYSHACRRLAPRLLDWFATSARDLPWRRTRNPYAVWVSEIMLQQTQVKTVIPYWNRWMHALPTIESVAHASSPHLHKLWEGLGYYTRVRNMQKAALEILTRHGGKFPDQLEAVLALPGIGRYTAGAICSIAFNQPAPILDGNVIRVLTRIFGIAEDPKAGPTKEKLWQLAEKLVRQSTGHCAQLNESLMELGALICTPRNAQCAICPVSSLCRARKINQVDELPNISKRTTATARHILAFVIECHGKFLVRQRPAGVVNAHLWEFPNVESTAEPSFANRSAPPPSEEKKTSLAHAEAALHDLPGVQAKTIRPLCIVKHSITRYRITLEAFLVSVEKKPLMEQGHWLAPAEFDQIAFTSAHKKLASAAAQSILSGR